MRIAHEKEIGFSFLVPVTKVFPLLPKAKLIFQRFVFGTLQSSA
jgi:hypothetical protein